MFLLYVTVFALLKTICSHENKAASTSESRLRLKITGCLQNEVASNYRFNFEKNIFGDHLHIHLYDVVVLNF